MFLHAFKVAVFVTMTELSGVWVGLLVTSSKDIAEKAQVMFDWVSRAVKL